MKNLFTVKIVLITLFVLTSSVISSPVITSSCPALRAQLEQFIEKELNFSENNTALCNFMRSCGSDKSTRHNYTQVYHHLLEHLEIQNFLIVIIKCHNTKEQ